MTEVDPSAGPESIGALVLLSGGLDSQLAVCLLKDQGIRVHGITFESPFFCAERARRAAEKLGVPLLVEDFSSDIISILHKPPHGFGSNMNPCIDCHAAMLRRAGGLMAALNCSFICTGEVLNERPMSQNYRSLQIVEKCSGFEGFIVRPLSARQLPETEPERRGWIRREKLLDINGRRREIQLGLAIRYGLREFPSPAGGCLLTDPGYSARLRDLMGHEGLADPGTIALLRLGRHFRLGPAIKVVVGRNQEENAKIEKAAGPNDLVLRADGIPGPSCLLPAAADERQTEQAAAICARYSDLLPGTPARILVSSPAGGRLLEVRPATGDELDRMRV